VIEADMKSRKIPIFVALVALPVGSIAAGSRTAQALTLKSVDVTLPDSDRELPDGPGLAAVQSNCISCHTPGMILTQPAMPKAAWETEVAKMRNVYKAPVSEKDVPDIVTYLTAIKGTK
jgi:mono/diheme cytochrome c family protein